MTVGGEVHQWYSLDALDAGPFDLVLVDGPPQQTQPHARYPALPLVHGRLTARATVILDDYHRPDEHDVAQRWTKEFPYLSMTEVAHEKGTALFRRR